MNLTQPQVIGQIHSDYLKAGADIIETNTFSGTTIGSHDFLFQGEPTAGRKDQEFFQRVIDDAGLRALVREINFEAARIARQAADQVANETGQRRFVGGSMGPLPVAASISPDVNDPAFRAVSFDQLRQTYFDQAKALLEGGVDLLIVETIFDTLNGKAALFAITDAFGRNWPQCAVDDFGHRDRQIRTEFERPNRGSVPCFNRARATAHPRFELCTGSG